jgi:hypothetical protein
MNLIRGWLTALRTSLGLGDVLDDRLTPSHGWLLPTPEAAMALRRVPVPVPAGRPLR